MSRQTIWGRPNCCVRGCTEVCDYTVSIFSEKHRRRLFQANEKFDLCGKHYNEINIDNFLHSFNLADIPDKTKEKVEFT